MCDPLTIADPATSCEVLTPIHPSIFICSKHQFFWLIILLFYNITQQSFWGVYGISNNHFYSRKLTAECMKLQPWRFTNFGPPCRTIARLGSTAVWVAYECLTGMVDICYCTITSLTPLLTSDVNLASKSLNLPLKSSVDTIYIAVKPVRVRR